MILLEFGLGALLCAAAVSGSILIVAGAIYLIKMIYIEYKNLK